MPLQQLCPPEVFGIVEGGIYRSNSLIPINFPFVKHLKLKTVIQLSPEVPVKAVSTFFQENGIRHIHLGLKAWRPDESWKPVTEELIKEALELVLDTTYHPVMVMCASGIHQTGTLVGCLRRLQNWSLTSILVEYRSFAVHRSTRFGDEQFIELFDVDLVTLPQHLPDWFIEQKQMLVCDLLKNSEEEEEMLLEQLKEFEASQRNFDLVHKSNNNNNYRTGGSHIVNMLSEEAQAERQKQLQKRKQQDTELSSQAQQAQTQAQHIQPQQTPG